MKHGTNRWRGSQRRLIQQLWDRTSVVRGQARPAVTSLAPARPCLPSLHSVRGDRAGADSVHGPATCTGRLVSLSYAARRGLSHTGQVLLHKHRPRALFVLSCSGTGLRRDSRQGLRMVSRLDKQNITTAPPCNYIAHLLYYVGSA